MKESNFEAPGNTPEMFELLEGTTGERYASAAKKMILLIDEAVAEFALLEGLPKNDQIAYKSQVWKGVSAIGQIRAVMEGRMA